jgi:hypothetical protein
MVHNWWWEVAFIRVKHFTTYGQLMDAKMEAIHDEGAIHNIHNNPRNV